ncbi:HPF/RaiA family ribosome-associated protein [Chitinophaga alhagiae]|uniref:HPF/RaiA family ribosome-associated protein n=1 Tax=Chitinophaga alhagiae TaxID=2203219 RepID=UPI000E5BE3AF|nr:HPF/RaiA family ribosome-associated protein [Chitinophaga alhagiae]
MKFRIESPGHNISPSLKAFIKLKLGALDKYYKDLQEVEVTIENKPRGQRENIVCILNMRMPGKDDYVKANSPIFEDAILKAADAAKRRLRIRKTQLQNARKAQTNNRRVVAKKAAAGRLR